MSSTRNFTSSDFYCTHCGKQGLNIWRKKGQKRENGHLKNLFCIYCNGYYNHVECQSNSIYTKEDFEFEFKHNNFTEDGQRKMTYRQLRSVIENESKG